MTVSVIAQFLATSFLIQALVALVLVIRGRLPATWWIAVVVFAGLGTAGPVAEGGETGIRPVVALFGAIWGI
jgi:hypothetical protein